MFILWNLHLLYNLLGTDNGDFFLDNTVCETNRSIPPDIYVVIFLYFSLRIEEVLRKTESQRENPSVL